MRESRRLIRSARENPEALFDPDGGVRVLGVGELLPLRRRGGAPSPPVDVARTIEEVLTLAPLDFVHVHEPFAPSASSVALRHSRALNVGSFHAPTERVLSTQVARRFVELFFGRLDARTASFGATRELMERFFPASYRLLRPGAAEVERPPYEGPLRLAFCAQEERQALRLFLRALRRLPDDLEWQATVFSPTGAAPTGALRSRLRDRLTLLSADDTSENEVLANADVVVAASARPGARPRTAGARAGRRSRADRRATARLRGGAGRRRAACSSSPGTSTCWPASSSASIREPALVEELRSRARPLVEPRDGRGGGDLRGAGRHSPARRSPLKPEVRERLARRPMIDVDMHMHTDHSSDCVTPVEVLLATAAERGLGAIAVTDHNEISGAIEAREKAAEFGVKVIVGEEVKTEDQGEVIGLFIEEKIPRGMSLEETIAEIRRQGGLVYVPHPFDRLHSVPDYEHLLRVVDDVDAIEIFNPRIAIAAWNEEAVRFAGKYRIPGGAGSDAHVAQGLGAVRIRMRDFDGPEEFLQSLRDADILGRPSSLRYAQVQALKFLETRATPPAARRASRRRRVRRAVAGRDAQ